jgi:tRNA nucleotidyltransferase/poly(A) polymerase
MSFVHSVSRGTKMKSDISNKYRNAVGIVKRLKENNHEAYFVGG